MARYRQEWTEQLMELEMAEASGLKDEEDEASGEGDEADIEMDQEND